MKSCQLYIIILATRVAPARERGLKCRSAGMIPAVKGRSREGAWIEIIKMRIKTTKKKCRSREGAWIEIRLFSSLTLTRPVAPARERGLKCHRCNCGAREQCRSRKGAWIEIWAVISFTLSAICRSREGAWIEIRNTVGFSVLLTQITHSD